MTTRVFDVILQPKVPNGCHLHNDCFTCPFPDCIWSSENSYHLRPSGMKRAKEIIKLCKLGWSNRVIAAYLGISVRTVQRYLKGVFNGSRDNAEI